MNRFVVVGCSFPRTEERQLPARSFQLPPLRMRCVGAAAGCGAFTLLCEHQPYWSAWPSSFPKLNFVVVPARQAYSHSASVGRPARRPFICSRAVAFSFSMKRCASSQLTPSTGRWGTLIDIQGFVFMTTPHCACVN